VCPTTLSDWRRLRRALGPDTARVRFVFVSVDWRRDTPAVAAAFASRFDPTFVGVTADSTTLLGLLPSFKVASQYQATQGARATIWPTATTSMSSMPPAGSC